ncbi:hypothetical protein JZK55_00060 [Dissulfurispira thermophila]|uniref:Uncharacterized protein n=2 Tax=root TaxID=1 RepID=A0A7G1GXU6_9BACT|nr:hypothetical protein [Dissulfurispira thermophila]BCB95084.1 hypothetical protein JZK55_00060 [Dissulfurispira thermophila]
MRKNKSKNIEIIQYFSKERLDEFRHMSAKARLQWLEEANAFINKALGFKKRAFFDNRFKGMET